MEYTSQKDLYLALIPVFNVKRRLMQFDNFKITNKQIWTYLTNNKWKNSHNLTLSEIVNDIINVDVEKIEGYKE